MGALPQTPVFCNWQLSPGFMKTIRLMPIAFVGWTAYACETSWLCGNHEWWLDQTPVSVVAKRGQMRFWCHAGTTRCKLIFQVACDTDWLTVELPGSAAYGVVWEIDLWVSGVTASSHCGNAGRQVELSRIQLFQTEQSCVLWRFCLDGCGGSFGCYKPVNSVGRRYLHSWLCQTMFSRVSSEAKIRTRTTWEKTWLFGQTRLVLTTIHRTTLEQQHSSFHTKYLEDVLVQADSECVFLCILCCFKRCIH